MAASSTMKLAIGTEMPGFALRDVVSGEIRKADDFSDAKALLVVFLCRHCPYVVHVRPELKRIAEEFEGEGLKVVGISSNDPVSYPDDAPERLAEMVGEWGVRFPILFDETQEVARAYDAACTPDFFLFDGRRRLYYRGRMDDSTPGNGRPVTGADLRAAIRAVLAGEAPPAEQHPSVGCSIKWRK
ncbi:MAG: thioredoxin family protein [Chthoniobacterales bacterium]|nr:thioredoxin family protein [Chthoniobacterales bacterium]